MCAFASMGECPVAVLWVRRSETNRPSESLEDTRGELARKGLTHRRIPNSRLSEARPAATLASRT